MNKLQANICLLAVTLCWSCEVVLLSILPEEVGPFACTCVTSLIGAVLLFICFARRIVRGLFFDGFVLVRRIVFLSILNASYNILIEVALEYFDVSTGAFTLSMIAVILPVMLLVMHREVSKRTWASALLVLIGIIIASIPVFSSVNVPGFVCMFISCIIRALFIVKLSDYVHEHDPVALAAGISAVNVPVAFIPWVIASPMTFAGLPWSTELIAVFVIYSYFIIAFATVTNVFAQRRATPAEATIIFSTEIIFSLVWAVCIPDNIVSHVDITPYVIVGCLFIVLGNIVEIDFVDEFRKWQAKRKAAAALASEAGEAAIPKAAEPAPVESLAERMKKADMDDARVSHLAAAARSSNADIVTAILEKIKTPILQKLALFLILLAVYMVISLPFKVLSIIPGFTDIRPVCMLQPVYGIFFGLPGCFAFAVGNVISDILSDSLRWTSIAGFIGNFAYPFLMWLIWTKLRKKPFHLRTRGMILAMVGSILFCSLVETAIIAPAVAIVYPEVDILVFTGSCIANTSVFSMAFAIPFMILIQEELGFPPLGAQLTDEDNEDEDEEALEQA